MGSVAPPTDGAAAAADSASAGDQLVLGLPAPAVQELTLEEELALVRNMNMAKSSWHFAPYTSDAGMWRCWEPSQVETIC